MFLIQTCSYEQTDTNEKMINRNVSQWFSLYLYSWKCVIDMLLCSLTNTVIWTNRRNSRLDRVSKEYTEQIRKRYCRIPLDFSTDILFSSLNSFAFCPLIFCFLFSWNQRYIFWYTFDYAGGLVIKNFLSGWFLETRIRFILALLIFWITHKTNNSRRSFLSPQSLIYTQLSFDL